MRNEERRVGRITVEGTEVLSYRIRLPEWQEYERISAFYDRIAEQAQAFCETDLRARAEEEYFRSDDPRKRFSYPALRYRLESEIGRAEEGRLTVRLVASLARGGERLARSEWTHTWSLSEEWLLPVKKSKKFEKTRKKLEKNGKL
jgi:hypothetical protein